MENIKLQDAYCQLIEEQERKREENLKERNDKIKAFTIQAESKIQKDYWDRVGKLEERAKKYEVRLEKKRDIKEENEKLKIIEQKKKMKDYLFMQMEEKKNKKKLEKIQHNEQATMWKTDAVEFFKFENDKENTKKEIMKRLNYCFFIIFFVFLKNIKV